MADHTLEDYLLAVTRNMKKAGFQQELTDEELTQLARQFKGGGRQQLGPTQMPFTGQVAPRTPDQLRTPSGFPSLPPVDPTRNMEFFRQDEPNLRFKRRPGLTRSV